MPLPPGGGGGGAGLSSAGGGGGGSGAAGSEALALLLDASAGGDGLSSTDAFLNLAGGGPGGGTGCLFATPARASSARLSSIVFPADLAADFPASYLGGKASFGFAGDAAIFGHAPAAFGFAATIGFADED